MAIQDVDRLLGYIDVVYFRPQSGRVTEPNLAEGSGLPPPGLVPFESGLTVKAALADQSDWSPEDRAALRLFLDEPRTQRHLRRLLNEVEEAKQRVRDHGSWTARLLAGWWDAGVHPLQPRNEDD